jgi:hypothetical protein
VEVLKGRLSERGAVLDVALTGSTERVKKALGFYRSHGVEVDESVAPFP